MAALRAGSSLAAGIVVRCSLVRGMAACQESGRAESPVAGQTGRGRH